MTSVTMGVSPFFANKKYYPKLQTHLNHDLPSDSVCPFIAELESTHARLKQSIAEAQARYQGPTNTKHSAPPDIKIEDLVFILAKNI